MDYAKSYLYLNGPSQELNQVEALSRGGSLELSRPVLSTNVPIPRNLLDACHKIVV